MLIVGIIVAAFCYFIAHDRLFNDGKYFLTLEDKISAIFKRRDKLKKKSQNQQTETYK